MLTVHKATINFEDIADRVEIDCPAHSEILSADVQFPGQIAIWYRCDPGQHRRRRTIHAVVTGQPAPADARFISTLLLRNGALVFHLFDQGEE
ncbi:hypothetical protein AGRO_3683 [Agrobacterium sp. ATCC 31749]|uniref:DUF7352 domain-containing protein n=1 Tax=unclassified Agrobacterium TaxID=2632611 RepID=UPI00020DB748|nr:MULTISPECIES: hypothetical protein [unclassified Agrobacterium]EGL63614.1 hypothetical protein AGRO_3683 [Agrobacterium sp. ATCC 31749]QKW97076.1 hypothetical protein GSF67_08240 [Agrobacterium sp. CGMCC 11546]